MKNVEDGIFSMGPSRIYLIRFSHSLFHDSYLDTFLLDYHVFLLFISPLNYEMLEARNPLYNGLWNHFSGIILCDISFKIKEWVLVCSASWQLPSSTQSRWASVGSWDSAAAYRLPTMDSTKWVSFGPLWKCVNRIQASCTPRRCASWGSR